jgi:hypothetical protein
MLKPIPAFATLWLLLFFPWVAAQAQGSTDNTAPGPARAATPGGGAERQRLQRSALPHRRRTY